MSGPDYDYPRFDPVTKGWQWKDQTAEKQEAAQYLQSFLDVEANLQQLGRYYRQALIANSRLAKETELLNRRCDRYKDNYEELCRQMNFGGEGDYQRLYDAFWKEVE